MVQILDGSGRKLPLPRGRSGSELARLAQTRPEGIQGNEAIEFDVLGFVDHTHSTATEFLDDAVVRDGSANHGKRLAQS